MAPLKAISSVSVATRTPCQVKIERFSAVHDDTLFEAKLALTVVPYFLLVYIGMKTYVYGRHTRRNKKLFPVFQLDNVRLAALVLLGSGIELKFFVLLL